MNTAEELDIITRMRGEVMSRKDITGENLFLAWGYPTAIILFTTSVLTTSAHITVPTSRAIF